MQNTKEKEQEEEPGVHSNFTYQILSLIALVGILSRVLLFFQFLFLILHCLEKDQHLKGLRLLSH